MSTSIAPQGLIAPPGVAAPAAVHAPRAVPLYHRVWFTLGVLAGLFPATTGLFAPGTLDRVFTWADIPEMHARFVGALYTFAVLYTLGCLFARRMWQTADAHWAIIGFTGIIGALNLMNLDAFDFDATAPKVWFAIYVVFPIAGIPVALLARRRSIEPATGGVPIAPWARMALRVQGVVFMVLGAALLVAREELAERWPWPVSAPLAQFYAAAFLAIGWLSWRAAGMRTWRAFATLAVPFVAFSGLTFVASLANRDLFDGGDPASWLWYGGFGAATVACTAMLATMVRERQFTIA
jgi:hypothetical protein